MDDQRTDREGGGLNQRRFTTFRLKWLLIAFVPLSVALAFYYHQMQHQMRIKRAYDIINARVFDAHYELNGSLLLFARNGNLTDSDLEALIPIGTGEVAMGDHKVIRMELRGSKVSEAAVSQFRREAPECELVR